jgi:hypothetical protein
MTPVRWHRRSDIVSHVEYVVVFPHVLRQEGHGDADDMLCDRCQQVQEGRSDASDMLCHRRQQVQEGRSDASDKLYDRHQQV